jgi:hypothetical protein
MISMWLKNKDRKLPADGTDIYANCICSEINYVSYDIYVVKKTKIENCPQIAQIDADLELYQKK